MLFVDLLRVKIIQEGDTSYLPIFLGSKQLRRKKCIFAYLPRMKALKEKHNLYAYLHREKNKKMRTKISSLLWDNANK